MLLEKSRFDALYFEDPYDSIFWCWAFVEIILTQCIKRILASTRYQCVLTTMTWKCKSQETVACRGPLLAAWKSTLWKIPIFLCMSTWAGVLLWNKCQSQQFIWIFGRFFYACFYQMLYQKLLKAGRLSDGIWCKIQIVIPKINATKLAFFWSLLQNEQNMRSTLSTNDTETLSLEMNIFQTP